MCNTNNTMYFQIILSSLLVSSAFSRPQISSSSYLAPAASSSSDYFAPAASSSSSYLAPAEDYDYYGVEDRLASASQIQEVTLDEEPVAILRSEFSGRQNLNWTQWSHRTK